MLLKAEHVSAIRQYADGQMQAWGIPGLSIGLFDGEKDAFIALGTARADTGDSVTPNTLFPAGSVSKAFTATLVMTLVDEGLVDLDVPVIEYVPGLRLSDPEAQEQVTLRHLLTHSSGIFGDYFDDHGQGDDALERALKCFADLSQLHKPGAMWAYSNSSFCLAGAVAARVLGVTYEQAMLERVVDPLGMDRTVLFPHDAIAYPVAVGHTTGEDGKAVVNRKFLVTRYMSPPAGVITTAEDMIRFARFHLGFGPHILSNGLREQMQQGQIAAAHRADEWGLGWGIKDLGTKVVEHTGSVNATAAQLTMVPDQNFAVCVLANGAAGLGATRSLCNKALEICCGVDTSSPPRADDVDNDDLKKLAGLYRQPSGDVQVFVEEDQLRIEPSSGASYRAYPIDPSRFVIMEGAASGLRVEFLQGDEGEVFVNINGRLLAKVD